MSPLTNRELRSTPGRSAALRAAALAVACGLAPLPGAVNGAVPSAVPGAVPGQASGVAQDTGLAPAGATAPAFVELVTARDVRWLEESVDLVLRFGIAADLAREGLLQLFQTRLDVPVHVSTEGLDELAGALLETPAGSDPRDATCVVDDAVVRARRVDDRTRDGTRLATFEVALRLVPTAPGRLVLPAPSLRFAWATRFEERFADGRVALDRREGLVAGEPLVLDVRPLPDEGRPEGFSGAVGHFALDATLEPREVRVGESVKLVLSITGEGNHGRFDAPALARLAGFRVLGTLVERDAARLVATYDLAPEDSAVERVPEVGFASFVPGPQAGYTVLTTPSFPIRVLPARATGSAAEPGTADTGSHGERQPSRRASRAAWGVTLGALALVLAVIAIVRRATRAPRAR